MKTIAECELEDLKFDNLDKKMKFIQDNRENCEDIIYNLNREIASDYVRQSEALEPNNALSSVKGKSKSVYFVSASKPYNPNWLPKTDDPDQISKAIAEQHKNAHLVMLYEDADGNYIVDTYLNPGHVCALNYALKRAREDKEVFVKTGNYPEIDIEFLEKINAELLREKLEQDPEYPGYGKLRDHTNVVLDDDAWLPSDHSTVYGEICNLLEWFNSADNIHPIAKAIIFKVKFTHIHPFGDGNGRTSRILMNYILNRYGFPTISICAKKRKEYIEAMDDAILNDNYAPLVSMIENAIDSRCNQYISEIMAKTEENSANI